MINERRDRYGAVVVDPRGRFLLHKPSTSFDLHLLRAGRLDTCPRGRAEPEEHGEASAARGVREETGWDIDLLDPLPGSFEETTGRSHC